MPKTHAQAFMCHMCANNWRIHKWGCWYSVRWSNWRHTSNSNKITTCKLCTYTGEFRKINNWMQLTYFPAAWLCGSTYVDGKIKNVLVCAHMPPPPVPYSIQCDPLQAIILHIFTHICTYLYICSSYFIYKGSVYVIYYSTAKFPLDLSYKKMKI